MPSAPSPVVLVFGNDATAVRDEIAKVRRSVLEADGAPTGFEAFNHERFEGQDVKEMKTVLTACATMPVGAKCRLVELSMVEQLGKGTKREDESKEQFKKRMDKDLDALVAYIADPSPSTVLLLSGVELKANSKIANAAKKSAHATIQKFEVKVENPLWDLTDALGRRDAKRALALVAEIYGEERGEAIYALVPALASHMRKVYGMKAAPRAVSGPDFVVRKLRQQAQNFDEATLRDAMAGLARLDAQTKGAASGAKLVYAAPLVALQRWILQVCGALPDTEPMHR